MFASSKQETMMKMKHYLFSGLASASVAVLGLVPAGATWAADAAPAVEVKADSPAAALAKDADTDPRTNWEQTEVKLIEMIGATVDNVSKENTDAAKVDWAVVKKSVADAIFRRATSDNKPPVWPASQLSWVQGARKGVERLAERAMHEDEDHSKELIVLESLVAALKEESAAAKEEVASKPGEAVEVTDDDNLWRYRDKSGARTTKPRYKGQEPVN